MLIDSKAVYKFGTNREKYFCCFLIIVSFCPMNASLASFKVRTARTSKHAKMAFIEQKTKKKHHKDMFY